MYKNKKVSLSILAVTLIAACIMVIYQFNSSPDTSVEQSKGEAVISDTGSTNNTGKDAADLSAAAIVESAAEKTATVSKLEPTELSATATHTEPAKSTVTPKSATTTNDKAVKPIKSNEHTDTTMQSEYSTIAKTVEAIIKTQASAANKNKPARHATTTIQTEPANATDSIKPVATDDAVKGTDVIAASALAEPVKTTSAQMAATNNAKESAATESAIHTGPIESAEPSGSVAASEQTESTQSNPPPESAPITTPTDMISGADEITAATTLNISGHENASNTNALYVVIVILSLTTLLAVWISFYLYKWRRILLANKDMVVPEEWAKYLMNVGDSLDKFGGIIGESLDKVTTETKNNSTQTSAMVDTYMELQAALDDKDAEIKRLKAGYDAVVFKKFISRFARIDQAIDDFILEEGESEILLLLKKLFEDAFAECSVTKYEPAMGDDYRKAFGVADNPKIKATDNSDEEFLISEVLESGYQINSDAEPQIIIPAKVRIYKLN